MLFSQCHNSYVLECEAGLNCFPLSFCAACCETLEGFALEAWQPRPPGHHHEAAVHAKPRTGPSVAFIGYNPPATARGGGQEEVLLLPPHRGWSQQWPKQVRVNTPTIHEIELNSDVLKQNSADFFAENWIGISI